MSIACSSTPVRGLITYGQTPKFGFTRAFMTKIRTGLFTWIVTQVDNQFTYSNILFPNDQIVIVLNPKVWEWSTNGYTLDFVICESYYHRLLTGIKDPAPAFVGLTYEPPDWSPALLFYNTDGILGGLAPYDMPGATEPYWVPGL